MNDQSDRRRHRRHPLVRDGKVREPRGGRCLPCRTLNVSDSGALLCVRGGRGMPEGHRVQLAIDWMGRGMPVRLGAMQDAVVVRTEADWQGTTVVGVRFADAGSLARAA